jgi:hypothetical protein
LAGVKANFIQRCSDPDICTENFIFEKDANEVLIKVKIENNRGWNSWGSDNGDDLEIFVPRQSKVYYIAVNADVES